MSLTINGSGGGIPVGTPTIETGSYVGAGTYGSTNKNSITFERTPVFVLIIPNTLSTGSSGLAFMYPQENLSRVLIYYSNTTGWRGWTTTLSGTTVSWYSSISKEEQFNSSTVTYRYFAVTI